MSYSLDSTIIKNPQEMTEINSTQMAQIRTLSGAVGRDYFGSNKRVWTLKYRNIQKSDYDTIKTIYTSYLTIGTAKSWSVSETNYTISATTVHIDLQQRDFTQKGSGYLSDFDLVLTEA